MSLLFSYMQAWLGLTRVVTKGDKKQEMQVSRSYVQEE